MVTWILLGLRWSARITGLLLAGMVLLFFMAGEGPPNPFNQPPPVQIEFLGMGLMVSGFLLGWCWEGVGGLVALIGFLVFSATELAVNGVPPHGAIPLFAVPAVLFLLTYGTARRMRRAGDVSPPVV
jgi:hypothetical protein